MSVVAEDAVSRVGPTLRRRLGFALGGRLLGAWALTTLGVGAAVIHDLDELYDASLLSAGEVVEALGDASIAPGGGWREIPLAGAATSPIAYRLRVRAGAPDAVRDAGTAGEVWRAPIARRGDERSVQVAFGPSQTADGAQVLEIAHGVEERRLAVLDVMLAMLLPALLIVPVGVLGLRSTLARELAPLDALAAEIDRRDADDLSAVAATGVPGELDPIVQGLDRLLLRLRRALDAEHDFAGTAAHELRTPLAGALAQVQRLIVETDGPPRARARRIERSLRDLRHLTTRLLELARTGGAGTTLAHAVDLAPTLERTLSLLAEEHDAGSRLVLYEADEGSLRSRLDPDLFSVLVRNLVENALVHGMPGASVIVTTRYGRLDIDSAGPALDVSELTRLGQRFTRGAGGGRGAGLGLAIVQAIADGGGARVELLSPLPDRADGVRAQVTLEALTHRTVGPPDAARSRPRNP